MTQVDEKLIEHLNHLITICNDGKYGFEMACKHAKSDDLKKLFGDYMFIRDEFVNELKYHVRKLGGDPEQSGGTLGMLHRTWMDIKNTFSSTEDTAILEACLTGERAAINAYKEVLEKALIPADTRNVVASQHTHIEEALKKIEGLLAKKRYND